MIYRVAALAAASALAACAPYDDGPDTAAPVQTASSERDCFQVSQIGGYTHAGRDRIHVSTGPGETYVFEVAGVCPQLRDAESMAFDTVGSGRICSGIDVDLIVPSTIGPSRCPVRMISKLPPEPS